jgi:hypothetical protein
MTFIALKSKKEAETAFATAKAMLTDKTAKTNTKELSDLLKNALITYSLRLNDEGSKGVAKEWMELGMDLFQNDKEYKVTYDSING